MPPPRNTTLRLLLTPALVASLQIACSGSDPSDTKDPDAGPVKPSHGVVRETCASEPFSPAHQIEPGFSCTPRPGATGILDCVIDVTCKFAEDCTDAPFGRCVGFARDGCDYGIVPGPCANDADCAALPNGKCLEPMSNDMLCFPDGECQLPEPRCQYPALLKGCLTNFDCTDAPGGRCEHTIGHTHCDYQTECAADADCGSDARCVCGGNALVCIEAECFEDADCGADGLCLQENPCGFGGGAFRCTTPADECAGDANCALLGPAAFCSYSQEEARWVCKTEGCLPP